MYEKVKQLADENNVSFYKIAKDLGLSQSMFSSWKAGKYEPKMDKIQLIADYFGVPVSYFYEGNALVEAYKRRAKRIHEASAGTGRLNESYEEVRNDDDYTKVRICGDSMTPSLMDGDIVKVRFTTDVSPNEFTILKINGDECVCKHVETAENGIWIRSENPEYEDVFFTVKDVLSLPITIIGVAEEIVSRKL